MACNLWRRREQLLDDTREEDPNENLSDDSEEDSENDSSEYEESELDDDWRKQVWTSVFWNRMIDLQRKLKGKNGFVWDTRIPERTTEVRLRTRHIITLVFPPNLQRSKL